MANTPKGKQSSQIPVMTPRQSQSSLPSSLSTPQLGLVPQGRYLSVSDSPSFPGNTPSNTSSGMTSFRSFRNLLPFGSGKNALSPAGSPQSVTPTRTSLGGTFRRSAHGERSVSAPHLPTKPQVDTPVLSIQLSHRVDEPLFGKDELQNRLGMEPTTPETAFPSPLSSAGSFQVVEQPLIVASDLSTILEADTSGISKHLSDLDDLNDRRSQVSPKTMVSPPLSRSGSNIQDTSVLDLSTSNIGNEVLAALSASGRQNQGWLTGVVVDADTPMGEGADPDGSFDLGALDRDLAAILRPSRFADSEPALLVGIGAISPPLLTPPLTEGRRGSSRTPSPRLPTQDLAESSRAPPTAGPSPTLSMRQVLPSPGVTSSLSKPINLKPPPIASTARLGRSASEKPSYFTRQPPLPSPTRTEPIGRQSIQLPVKTPSPLLRETILPQRPTSSDGTETENHRSALSRLATPSRHLAAANNARASLGQFPSPTSSPGRDGTESVSSRSPSAVPSRRPNGHRPSLDTGAQRLVRTTRDRSASLTNESDYRAPTQRTNDWMGPRTARVFAAAGLLDSERMTAGPSTSRPGSRFGFGGSRSERDFRSSYAPSRAGFSEVGSSASWSRRSGSISHTVNSSERGTPNSDITTPRTTYSAASTAPTSISAASSVQKILQSELNQLQERHSTETSALLNALADSQRTTRLLREENTQLRDRVQYLEDELVEAQEALHQIHFTPPLATSTLPRSFYRNSDRQQSPRRSIPHSRLQTLLHPNSDNENDKNFDANALQDPPHDPMPMNMSQSSKLSLHEKRSERRFSNSSSVFPSMPSNMPMLLQEDGGSLSMSPPSPSMLAGAPPRQAVHHRNQSSAGNISPTTANFSMMTGSPRSLDLRSEHERLLGDMPTLDLNAEDYETHAFHDL
ncbi:hypothetical protein BDW22DRAFT_1362775 [Trametopsis cervina]|nr:hypothetical protein BDW22DRAFT_1362775 [Trametopsis cervina]